MDAERRWTRSTAPAALAALLAVVAGCEGAGRQGGRPAAPLSVAESLSAGSGSDAGFSRALEVRRFVFPDDHGPHPEFHTEWWYLTGNLTDSSGRHFGYQATFFRNALAPESTSRESAWATRQIYLGHFGLTDTGGGRFFGFERFGRGAAGIAGARADPFRVWLEDWELSEVPATSKNPINTELSEVPATSKNSISTGSLPTSREVPATSPGVPATSPEVTFLPRLRLAISEGEVGLDLELEAGKPPVFHGQRGLSRKGSEPGNASYYYSYTRLATRGTVRIDGRSLPIAGLSWMDREWSTSVLEEGQIGWDWVSLQFPDASELMLFQLRRTDGSLSTVSGTWVEPGGSHQPIDPEGARLTALATWTSPETGITYPSGWRLEIDSRDLDVRFSPTVAGQEHTGTIAYWEGAVVGTSPGSSTPFRGYVELTGYGEGAGAALR